MNRVMNGVGKAVLCASLAAMLAWAEPAGASPEQPAVAAPPAPSLPGVPLPADSPILGPLAVVQPPGAPFAVPRPARAPAPPPPRQPLPSGALPAPAEHVCPTPAGPMLTFTAAVRPETEIVIAAVGDVLLHGRLQRQAFGHPDGFRSLWRGVEDLLGAADLTYANLEGPMAAGVARGGGIVPVAAVERFDEVVYTSYPMFNYSPRLGPALREAGVDVVSTANNHSLDRFAVGVDRTIAALEAAGLPFTGTRPTGRPDHPWYAVTEARGARIAWLACSYGTNGMPDRHGQVLLCFDQRRTVLDTIADLSRRPGIDAVILTPHWGLEYVHRPGADQRSLAHEAIEAGAIAVIGSHPHVVQPWERHDTADGRQGFVIYSLGNFVSGQRELPRRTSVILLLGLARTPDGRLAVAGARHIPIRVTERGGPSGRDITVEAVDRLGAAGREHRDHLARLLHPANRHPPRPPFTTIGGCAAPAIAPPPAEAD